MPEDLHICPPDHLHEATQTCNTSHGCRCSACRANHRDYQYFYRHMVAAGRRDAFETLVPVTGTQRRIQALMHLGWSQVELGRRLGVSQSQVSLLIRQRRSVTKNTHARVSALFEALCLQIPPATTKGQRVSVNKTRALARRNGWLPPLAWDDIDSDPDPRAQVDVNETPVADDEPEEVEDAPDVDEVAIELALQGHRVRLTPAERSVCVERLHAKHYSDPLIAATIGCADRTVLRIRERLGLDARPTNDLIDRSAA